MSDHFLRSDYNTVADLSSHLATLTSAVDSGGDEVMISEANSAEHSYQSPNGSINVKEDVMETRSNDAEFFQDLRSSEIRKNISFVSPTRGESNALIKSVKNDPSPVRDDKIYCLFVAPSTREGLSNFCFKLIGSGATICIDRNCVKKHHGGAYPVIPSEAFVQKDRNRAFANPTIDLDLIDPNLAATWVNTSKTLDDWTSLFTSSKEVNNNRSPTDKKPIVSSDQLLATLKEKAAKLAHKTPHKRKFESLELSSYQSELANKEEFKRSVNNATDLTLTKGLMVAALLDIEDRMKLYYEALQTIQAEVTTSVQDSHLQSSSNDTKISAILSLIGTKPTLLNRSLNGPDIWSVIGAIADDLQEKSTLTNHQKLISQMTSIESHLGNVSVKAQQLIQDSSTTQMNYIKRFESAATNVFKNIKNDISNLEHQVNHNRDNSVFGDPKNTDFAADIASLKTDVISAHKQITSIISSSDDQAISFGKLGFRSFEESSAWYEMHASIMKILGYW